MVELNSERERGQALVELLLSLPLIITVAMGAAMLFRTEWDRTRCAYQVFLSAHRALHSVGARDAQALIAASKGVRVEDTDIGIKAQAKCGDLVETVELPTLEESQW